MNSVRSAGSGVEMLASDGACCNLGIQAQGPRGFGKLVADAGTIGVGRAAQAAGQVATVRISSDMLSPAQLGSVAEMASVANFFSLTLVIPIIQYVTRRFLEWHEAGRLIDGLKKYILYVILSALAALLLALVGQQQFSLVNGFNGVWVAGLTGVFVLSSSISQVGITGFNLLNHRMKAVALANIAIWAGLGLSVAMFLLHPSPWYWSLGQFAGLSISGIALVLLLRELRHATVMNSKHAGQMSRDAFRFGWPVAVQATLWWIQSQSYRFILERVSGPESVGLVTMGYVIGAMPIALYEGMFGQFYEPIYYSELKHQDRQGQAEAWNNYARSYVPGVILVGIFTMSAGPFLARILLAEKFQIAAVVVIWASVTESIRGIGAMMHHLGVAKMDMRINLVPLALGAVLAPLCVGILARIDPLVGTGVGLCIAGVAVFIVIVIMSRRVMPISWPVALSIRAVYLGCPMVALFVIASWAVPKPTISLAIAVVTAGVVYLMIAQIWLMKSLYPNGLRTP